MNTILNDQAFMAEALRLANKGLYTTRSNPRVGCIIVKDNEIIGRGFHDYPGKPHAEICALNSVNYSARDATVYVTLEPCAHHGKTPPCSEALINANVKKVIIAMLDPNPLVNGKGVQLLQSNGIKTVSDIMAAEAAELNKGFIQRVTNQRPYITVKSAISLDGKTALKSGESKWISCDASRKDVQKLRARSCAILTSIETVLSDDPLLNVRLTKNDLALENEINQPKRVILDTQLRIPLSANILKPSNQVIIYTCSNDSKKLSNLKNLNIEVIQAKRDKYHINLNYVVHDLADREINELLVEAGSTLVGSFFENKLVDEIIIYQAPHIMGNTSLGLAELTSIETMQDRVQLYIQEYRKLGQDMKLTLKPQFIEE